jgi:hypothetical protein
LPSLALVRPLVSHSGAMAYAPAELGAKSQERPPDEAEELDECGKHADGGGDGQERAVCV